MCKTVIRKDKLLDIFKFETHLLIEEKINNYRDTKKSLRSLSIYF